jgi:RHS repeat-associated protein
VPTFGFTGELQDVSAGLVNLRARWYSTARGRFTSVDPFAGMMETPYSLHQYQYGYADPVLNRDPSGRDPKDLPCQPFDLLDPTNPNTCKTKPVTSPLPPGGAPSPTSAPGVPPGVSQPRNPHPVSLPDAADQLIADMRYYSNTPEAGTVQYFVGLSHLFVLPDCAFNRIATLPGLIAYKLWRDYVKDKAPLDVKKRYERDYGRYMPMFGDTWDNQLSGNLLFGFVGMHVGFTEAELLNGAGLAQYAAHCLDKYQPGSMGPGAEDCGVVSSSFRASSAIMFGIIADDNQVKDDERTELIGKGPDLVRFGAELAKEPFQQVG